MNCASSAEQEYRPRTLAHTAAFNGQLEQVFPEACANRPTSPNR